MTTVNGWESLFIDTKISILVDLGVLDSPLCEINMNKLNKQHISETGYYEIFCRNLFKVDTVMSDFSDYCCRSLENENTLAIEKRKRFKEAATEKCS